jgi:RND family efflux transporter MFP subunit
MSDDPKQRQKRGWLRIILTALVCLAILTAAGATIVVINLTEPTAQQTGATRKSAALVQTVAAQRGTYRPVLSVLGTVEPAQDIILSPRVGGQVVEIATTLIPGGVVRQGDLLLRIDPADFRNTRAMRQSELQQAQASLAIEQGRRSVAEKELKLLEGSIDDSNRALVLREPQIDSIRARITAAEAMVEQAELDLQRTSVTAPFDAQIIHRTVNVGSQVAAGDELARLVGVDEYWVTATVPVRHLRWVQFPETDGEGSAVTLRNPGTWSPGTQRAASVLRMIGTVDQQTRLARVLISVPDPLARQTDAPPMILGTLVETHIEGRPIENVIRLDRDLIRERDTVWVMAEGQLDIREVEIVFRDAQHAYLRNGLDEGDEVVITTLATVSEGIPLRREDPASSAKTATDEEASP